MDEAPRKRQPACKPGSVWPGLAPRRDGHSSGTPVAGRLKQPTRATGPTEKAPRPKPRVAPIRFCSRRGLPCRRRCRLRGALLPHPFTLAPKALRPHRGGLLSVALSLGSPPPDVIRRRIRMEPGLSSAFAAAVRPTGGCGIGAQGAAGQGEKPCAAFPLSHKTASFIAASVRLWECAARGGWPASRRSPQREVP